MKQVLFLCTGNYYRSRFAEIFFNWHARELKLSWYAASRGLALDAGNAGPISSHAVERLTFHRIPFEQYLRVPAPVTEIDLESADCVIAVKASEHQSLVRALFPHWLEQIEFWHIDDLDCALPEEALPCLEQEVLELLKRLKSIADSTAA